MSDEQLQVTRDFILRAAARFPRGITRTTLDISAASAGLTTDKDGANSMQSHIEYLIGAGLLARKPKAHTASLELYAVTPAGDDYLRSQKLL
ncbi:MAG TPA: hypothetical protein PKA41_14525 [Verrucomicrobiota bacterium]|nr:hypothetical protein [Verrucomicrobiota bacterium]